MTLTSSGPNCPSTFSHTCEKPDDECVVTSGFDNGKSSEIGTVSTGYKSCQIVSPGSTAEFLLKDGNPKNGCGTATKTLVSGEDAVCETLGATSCTGGGNIGKECVWRIEAPDDCPNGGGAGGDPHIKTWNGGRFSYHGECDLVMIHNEGFGNYLGLDLHIRTKIRTFYSYIEAIALRIGKNIIEVQTDSLLVDGTPVTDENLPLATKYFTLQAPQMVDRAKVYQVDLLDTGDSIRFLIYNHFLSFQIAGHDSDFEASAGLLGDFHTGKWLARDGITLMDSTDEYGAEWQVREDEPQLFQEWRDASVACVLPDDAPLSLTDRKLRATDPSEKNARKACAHKAPEEFDFCVYDVLATDDVGMAGAW